MADLRLDDVRKSFGPVQVLHGIDLVLASGEMLVIVGASGWGVSNAMWRGLSATLAAPHRLAPQSPQA